MAKRSGRLIVVEDEDEESKLQSPASSGSEDECIVFPSKRAPAPKIEEKPLVLKQSVKPEGVQGKANPKKRPLADATASPAKKTKVTTPLTEEPTAPHQNYNEDLTAILAGSSQSNDFSPFLLS